MYCRWECQLEHPSWKSLALSAEDEHTHTYDPASPLLGIYPTEMCTHTNQESTYTYDNSNIILKSPNGSNSNYPTTVK